MLGDHVRMVGLALAWTDVIALLAGLVPVVKHVSLVFASAVTISIALVCIYLCHELIGAGKAQQW